jgi:hypothetical protein
VQTAVDTEHALIVAQKVSAEATDNRSLLPMAEAAKTALDNPETLNLIADAGYSNGDKRNSAKRKGWCSMCQLAAPSTIRAMGRSLTAANSTTTKVPTAIAVQQIRRLHANSCSAIKRESFKPATRPSVARVL